ncbi:hypothetical protein [Mycolicibacterium mageritense]|uniref:hypothetical protein n=1 Tax=Mycolicibacterium mageritense TaxID=53462 RepID=UPI001E3A2F4F|nr:hypothetical protein [Mycolicibacterium mageritense]GJJ17357.1 hypothetical protein MTY414_10300 [Mycolicibacterium mageritense]
MGSRELVEGLLWRARAGIRVEGPPLRAGHGMADAAYRPPALPYASVVGPLNIELEPDRDPPRSVYLPVQAPGYLAGAERTAADPIPAPGQLVLRLDGDTIVTAAVNFGALSGESAAAEGVGLQAASVLETALRSGTFTQNGAAVTDQERLAELALVTARWDVARRRFVVASGRRGVVVGPDLMQRQPSSVELAEPAGTVAAALGFAATTTVRAPGRLIRHRRPTPTAVAVDVRVDLWSGSQSELASVLDAWTRSTATRGQLLVRPAILAEDVSPTDTSVRLLSPAEPAARTTIALLDVIDDAVTDRKTGRAARLVGAGAQVTDGALALTAAQRAELDFFELPPIPVAWAPDTPSANGYSATIGLSVSAGAVGATVRVLTVLGPGAGGAIGQGRTALRLDVGFVAAGAELRASAMRAGAGDFTPVSATVSTAALAAGMQIHVALDSRRGALRISVDGEQVGDGGVSPAGRPVGGPGMRLVLGPPPGAPQNQSNLAVQHVHLHGAPVGPPDPRLRPAAAPAAAWSPGDPFVLARSTDGVTTVGDGVAATVLGVQGDRVLLDRPVQAAFPRTDSIAYRRSEFFSQRALRRSDDLMNQLYRMSAEYRVSTVLDELEAGISSPLVESVDLQVRDFARLAAELGAPGEPVFSGRPAGETPGTTAVFTTNPPRSAKTTPETEPALQPTEASHG